MTSLSKIIKSPYRPDNHTAERKITLKEIKAETAADHEDNFESDPTEAKEVSQSEEARLEAAKEEVRQMQAALEEEKKAWEQEVQNQKQALEQEVEQRFNQAAEAGYDEGYQRGITLGKQEYTNVINEAKKLIESAKADYQRRLAEAEPDIIAIAAAMAEKVVSRSLNTNEFAWGELVKQAVSEVREQDEIKVYVHPDWYEHTLKHQQELQEIAAHSGEVVVYPDEQLQVDGCVLETPFGLVDASVDKQLKELRRQLFDSLKGGSENES